MRRARVGSGGTREGPALLKFSVEGREPWEMRRTSIQSWPCTVLDLDALEEIGREMIRILVNRHILQEHDFSSPCKYI